MTINQLLSHGVGIGIIYGILIALCVATAIVESRIAVEVKPKTECEMDIKMSNHILTLVQPCRIVSK